MKIKVVNLFSPKLDSQTLGLTQKYGAFRKWYLFFSSFHTCVSRLVQRGVGLKVVQQWMGHKSIQITLRYAHLAPSNLADPPPPRGVKALEATP